MTDLIIYQDRELELNTSLNENTIWLITEYIATLFDVKRPAIVKHIGNIYKYEELLQNVTCSILEQVTKDGRTRKVNYYNLDMIISVGHRVNSKKATEFRQWATSTLKDLGKKVFAFNKIDINPNDIIKRG